MMTLRKLELERNPWRHEADFGKVKGKAVFDGEMGEVEIKLTAEMVHRIFMVCADGIIGVAKEAATNLVLEAQATIAKESTPAIAGTR